MAKQHNLLALTSALIVGFFHLTLPAQAQIRIQHLPVKWGVEGQPITVKASLEGEESVDFLRLYYRKGGEESYQYVDMDQFGAEFTAEISAEEVVAGRIEYFIMAVAEDQVLATYPETDPYYHPVEVTITAAGPKEKVPALLPGAPAEAVPSKSLILSPEPGETVEPEGVVIALSLFVEEGEVDLTSIVLFLDGKKINAEITPILVSAAIPEKLKAGRHRVKLVWKDTKGKNLKPVEWSFVVSGKRRIASRFSGRFFAEAKDERVSGGRLSTNSSGLRFTGKYGILNCRGLIFVTSQEKRDQQPRNRFLLDVRLPLLRVKLGDTYPRFSNLILWGKRVRGVEANLRLGFFNLDFVSGETRRAVEGDSLISRYGTYKQNLIGIRPSFGSGRHFQLGFNLLKVKDVVSSITYGHEPKDNVVLGSDLLLAFDNHRVEFKAGAAISLLTEDISGGALSKADIDSALDSDIPFDPQKYEKYLVLNASTTPLDPSGLSSLAYNGSLKLNYMNNALTVTYKFIGSEYNSLGNTFIRKDIRGFSITDRLRLFRNRVYLTLGYDDYSDNLSEKDNKPSTDLKTFRAAVNFYLGRNLPGIGFGFKSYKRNNGITDSDTTQNFAAVMRENNTTQDISFQLNYDFNLLNVDHSISMSTFSSDKIDVLNDSTELKSDIRMVSLTSRYDFPLTMYLSYATNSNVYGAAGKFKFRSRSLKGEYKLFGEKLNIYAGTNITSGTSGGLGSNINYEKTTFDFGGIFRPTTKQMLLFDFDFINFKGSGTTSLGAYNPSYKDSIVRVRYEWRF